MTVTRADRNAITRQTENGPEVPMFSFELFARDRTTSLLAAADDRHRRAFGHRAIPSAPRPRSRIRGLRMRAGALLILAGSTIEGRSAQVER